MKLTRHAIERYAERFGADRDTARDELERLALKAKPYQQDRQYVHEEAEGVTVVRVQGVIVTVY